MRSRKQVFDAVVIFGSILFGIIWDQSIGVVASSSSSSVAPVCDGNGPKDGENCDSPQKEEQEESDDEIREPDNTCHIYWWKNMVLSGIHLEEDDPISYPEVMIPTTIHDNNAWPMWSRTYYFLSATGSSEEEADTRVFAPGITGWPFQCHKTLWNVKVANVSAIGADPGLPYANLQNPPLRAARKIQAGEALFLECRPELPRRSKKKKWNLPAPLGRGGVRWLHRQRECWESIRPAPSSIPGAGLGAFGTMNFRKGEVVVGAPLIHLRRSELLNEDTGQYELLLNYCYGHPRTPLLFLPHSIGVNYINHDRERANVKIRWAMEYKYLEDIFPVPSFTMFETELTSYELEFIATRNIYEGEEIFVDYGDGWARAWEQHGQNGDDDGDGTPFRHEIGLPDWMLPASWLANESMEKRPISWDSTDLAPGEVQRVRVKETGEEVVEYIHRVGMPADLTPKLLAWSDRMGITQLLKDYVLNGRALPVDGQEHHVIDGGTWWAKRFGGYWHSNMHYITPDDVKSDYDFMAALGEAGFDYVLQGLGEHFGLDGLVCYYLSFIAVSHCTGSFIHSDSDPTGGRRFNVIFPVLQVDNTEPELNLRSDNETLIIPYRYEPRAAVALGDDGYHGTAPCDYREQNAMRMVISVYMADVAEDIVDEVAWGESMDPPYPRPETQRRYFLAKAGRDWKKGDPSRRLPRTSDITMEEWASWERQ